METQAHSAGFPGTLRAEPEPGARASRRGRDLAWRTAASDRARLLLAGIALLACAAGSPSPACASWRPAPPERSASGSHDVARRWVPTERLGRVSAPAVEAEPAEPAPPPSAEEVDREFRRLLGILRRYPSRLDPHLGLGEIYFRSGNDLAARHHLEIYLEGAPSGPDSMRAALLHARALIRIDRIWDATVALESLARRPGAPPGVSHDLAILLQRDGRTADALAAEMRAVEHSGGDPPLLRDAAFRWKELGYPAEARRLFEILCASGQAEGEDQFQRGFLTHSLGDPAAARPAYEAAIALDPDHPEAHYNLGLVLAKEKDHDGAARQFREVIRLRPAYEPTYFELGTELLRAGRRIDAARVFRDYVRIGTDGAAVMEAAGILNALAPELPDSIQTTLPPNARAAAPPAIAR